MKYRNPLAFLEKMNGVAIDSADTAAVSLLRKKMLAEVELTEDKVLQINGEWCSKNDLLVFFDSLQRTTELQYHQEIKADPVLSAFLATGEMAGLFADKALYKDKSFLSFIAPFYEPLFTTAVLNSLQQQQFMALQYLFGNPVLLDGDRMKRSYDKVFRLLKEQGAKVEKARASLAADHRNNWRQVAAYVGHAQVQSLNTLPDAFHFQRSDYGIAMINFALVMNSNGYKEDALEILAGVQQLKSISYVQENVEKYIQYVKGVSQDKLPAIFKKEPTTKLGKLLAHWGLTKERLLQIGCSIFIVLVIIIGSRFEKKEIPKELFAPVEGVTFSGSRTYWTMNYLLSQLELNTPERVESVERNSGMSAPRTGDDLYGAPFMQALREQGDVGEFFVPPLFDPNRTLEQEDGRYVDPRHRQSLCVFNHQQAGLITLLQTPDSLYSCYIAPQDSAFIPLPLSLSQVYFYVGKSWNPEWNGDWAMKYVPAYRAKGFFMEPVFNSATFLRESAVQFILDAAYWKTSNRYIPMEVFLAPNQRLERRLLSANTNGVELRPGQ
jgi:hypothetical protein